MINTRLTTLTTLTAGELIPVGVVNHKSGCNVSANANSWDIKGRGYYKITANVTVRPTAVTPMTIAINSNGTTIASATETVDTAGNSVNICVVAIVYSRCVCNDKTITLTVNSAGTIVESDVIIEGVA